MLNLIFKMIDPKNPYTDTSNSSGRLNEVIQKREKGGGKIGGPNRGRIKGLIELFKRADLKTRILIIFTFFKSD